MFAAVPFFNCVLMLVVSAADLPKPERVPSGDKSMAKAFPYAEMCWLLNGQCLIEARRKEDGSPTLMTFRLDFVTNRRVQVVSR
jgi:hypothetical protein